MQTGDLDRAAQHLRSATAIARALHRLQGDTFLVDCVAAIQHANDEQRRALISAYVLYSTTYMPRDRGHDVAAVLSAAERNFRTGGSPMWIVVALRRLSTNPNQSEQVIRELLGASAQTHYVLRAELLSLLASHYWEQARPDDAKTAALQSIQIANAVGDRFQMASLAEMFASTLAEQQKRHDAWLMYIEAFKGMSLLGIRFLLSDYLDRAARWEAEAGHIDSAFALLALSTGASPINVQMYTNVDINRALAAYRDGRPIDSQIRESAAHTATHVRNEQARQIALNDLKLLDATVRLHSGKPRETIALIDQYFKNSVSMESRYFSAEAHFVRALAFRLVGDESKAMNDLRTATHEPTFTRRDTMAPMPAEFDIHEEVMDELVDILSRRGEIEEAFRTLGAIRRQGHLRAVHAAEAPPRDLLIVEYLALRDRLLVFIAQHGRVTLRTVKVDEQTLEKTTSAFGQDLARGVESSAAEKLSNWLLAPVFDRAGKKDLLMVIPDRALSSVPFAALRLNKTQRLVERIPLAFAPSNSLAAPPRPIDPGIALVVGNPTTRFQYASLPYAHTEAKSVARAYPMSQLLLGDQATWGNVFKFAEKATTLHFATHAIVGERGLPSQLVLSPSGASSGAWKLDRIQVMRLWRNPVIVLAGCRTGAPADRTESRTLALAFIYAGATAVIGTLWDVPDDQASVTVSVRLHQELRAGRDPANALRNVQLSMIRSADSRLRDPSRWSTYQVWSTTRDSFTGVAPWLDRDRRKTRGTKDNPIRCLVIGCRAFGEEVGTRHEHWLRCTEASCRFFRVHMPPSHVHASSRQQR